MDEGAGLVIAAGGDGTYNEVINGLALTDVPMAIVALGTTNVLAKELNIPEDVEAALKTAFEGNIHHVSLGRIDGRFFSLMAGIGFDGNAVYRVGHGLKRLGRIGYILSGLNVLLNYRPEEIELRIDDRVLRGYSAIIGNARCYGGNFNITPKADMLEPLLDLCLLMGNKRRDMLRYVIGIFANGRHLRFRDVHYEKVKGIEVIGNSHIQIDGDYFGRLPVNIEVVPDALRLIW